MKKDCYKFTVNHTHNLTPDMGRIINENKHSDFFIMTFICGTLRYPNDEINTLVFVKSAFLAPFKTSDGFYLAWEKLHPNWGNNWIEFGDPIEGHFTIIMKQYQSKKAMFPHFVLGTWASTSRKSRK